MDNSDANAWGCLRHHRDSAYQFEYRDTAGVRKPFRSRRRDVLARLLQAGTPDELGYMIEEDYRRKSVPREVAP